MEVAINAVWWVVSKALAPVSDSVLEAWAASAGLGPNFEALTTELLRVQAILHDIRSKKIQNPPLEALLEKLRYLGYDAEDVLDELDYFRIQDDLDGTSEAADEPAKGCTHNFFLNVHHTTRAVGKLLCLPASPGGARPTARGAISSTPDTSQANREVTGCMSKLRSCTGDSIHALGKRLPCSPLTPVDGGDDHSSSMLSTHGDTPKLAFSRVDISRRMKLIADQLRPMRQEVSKILRTLGHSSWSAIPDVSQSRPITASESIEPKLYGRDLVMNSIVHDITQGKYADKNLTVLPIVGPGGIGKTTLTQHIYHSQQVQATFEVKPWICVPLNFSVDKIMQEIEKYIPQVEDEKKGTAAELIGQRLKSKRFLLILDDIWNCDNEDEWKKLLLPFRKSQVKGNIIIVTTRLLAVAKMVKTTDQPIELEGLKHKELKELFLSFVFGDDDSKKDHPVLLEIGDKILGRLKGSPLATKTVGRLLRNHLDLDHWIRVLESKEWELQEGQNNIMPALKLSYDYLPFHLQQCFSYCALFPEGHKFDSTELIHFWIGLDILQSGVQSKSIEDIGQSNLNDLVSNGFFKKDETEGRTCYLIHDLLRDLGLKVVSCECLSIDRFNVRSVEIRPTVRHLSIIVDGTDSSGGITDKNFISELTKLKTRLNPESLQTLMIFGNIDKSFAELFCDLFGEVTALRVLRLPRMSCPVDSMLHNFPSLVHLRYLKLESMHGSGMHLPKTLSRFYHLRILDLMSWLGCIDLPKDMSNLARLRHFLTRHSELISNVGKLQFLQELNRFEVNKESSGFEIKQLGNLIELRELGIYNLEKVHKKEAAEAKLIDKNYLQVLRLGWDCERPHIEPAVEESVLESLQPNIHLKHLSINGHGGPSCPTWLSNQLSVKALQFLSLNSVAWEDLPSLGQMLMLKELSLQGMAMLTEFAPKHFGHITEHSFHNLKVLKLIGLERLKIFMGGNCYVFSQLQVLIISDCPALLELPSIPWTRTLRNVKISNVGSSLLESLEYSKSSSRVEMEICGKDGLHSLDEKVIVFNNLTDLRTLTMRRFLPMELKNLQMLASLESFTVIDSSHVFVPSGSEGEMEWQLPVENLLSVRCAASGKELTQLVSHLPKLSNLYVTCCENITRLGVKVNLKERTIPVSHPSTTEIVEAVEKEDDGLLLFPAHLSNSLQKLRIDGCPELRLLAYLAPPNDHEVDGVGGRGEGGGLQTLRVLRELDIWHCPKFFTACKTSCSSSCCLFPSSLQLLWLDDVVGMGTLEPLSNLVRLTRLHIYNCGDDLRSDGLWPLVTQGQLSELKVTRTPNFFVGSDPTGEQQDGAQDHLLRLQRSSKLRELETDDVAGVLVAPICTLLSSSLTKLEFHLNNEMERFTKEQEESLQLLKSLQDLEFWRFRKLQCLPVALYTLPNLKRLLIHDCPAISSLPKDSLPVSLEELDVSGCGNEELKQQCRNLQGHAKIKLTTQGTCSVM